ncbi:twin-arginine translocase TatA/TatE family subunit [Knoellia subterranea]|uniref:Preprotein translocase subunit TatA n=1 Tax=Knoellia subterranea KCTC 19937 TaxID=1385521 RepID=A0A0A0JUV0_9MICO|nr:twin-arginine translocase TatA/TatE family subunit [Knoellia subterranea]KGN39426.1 preprotein translocase subunit TatA [Knoellia subterranea KCTC 19937]
MIGINGWEFVLLALIAVFVLGPDRLPEYAQKLAQFIKKARVMAEGAKGQLKDQLGPDYDDINWRQYDPRQYDPRRIVREALVEPLEETVTDLKSSAKSIGRTDAATNASTDAVPAFDASTAHLSSDSRSWDPLRPTPYDVDAT